MLLLAGRYPLSTSSNCSPVWHHTVFKSDILWTRSFTPTSLLCGLCSSAIDLRSWELGMTTHASWLHCSRTSRKTKMDASMKTRRTMDYAEFCAQKHRIIMCTDINGQHCVYDWFNETINKTEVLINSTSLSLVRVREVLTTWLSNFQLATQKFWPLCSNVTRSLSFLLYSRQSSVMTATAFVNTCCFWDFAETTQSRSSFLTSGFVT